MSYDLKSALGWITAIAVVVSVATYLLSIPIGILVTITSPDLGSNLASLTGNLIVEAFLLAFEIPIVVNAAVLVSISMIIFVVCFAKAATSNGGFSSGIRLLLSGSRPRTLPNWLAIMPLVASTLFVVVVILILVQGSLGVSTGSLNCPAGMPNCAADLFASIVSAPVAEEFGFRITPIGLAEAILVAIKLSQNRILGSRISTRKEIGTFFTAFISPGHAKESAGLPSIRTGGLKGVSVTEWILLVFTAAVFGAYHVLGGGGWGPGKFATAALSGFTFGAVYLAYGAFADILLHWFFNFYFDIFTINTPFNGLIWPIGNLVELGCLAVGGWGVVVGVYWLATRKTEQQPGQETGRISSNGRSNFRE